MTKTERCEHLEDFHMKDCEEVMSYVDLNLSV